jgi:hypothetical protein
VARRTVWDPERASAAPEPIRAEELSTDARDRLLARAETRWQRLRAAARHASADWYWIGAELALGLPGAHSTVVARWVHQLHHGIRSATGTLDRLRRLEADVLAHEPDTDRWLRRQLATLEKGGAG